MKKVLVLMSVSAVLVLLFAPLALAEQHLMTASPTATATATASPTATATATASPTATATASPTATATVSPTATATASPTATATATALARTGGAPLNLPLTLVASVALVASGVGALVLMRRSVSQ